jgi:DNA-binding transcriptional MerR regulator
MNNENERLYLNNEVAEIVGITKRQVLSWTEKGLVVPSKESLGVGTKRGYNYQNLLEFGLCKSLFATGLGFRAIKRLINLLRKEGVIQDWANKWEEVVKRAHKVFKAGWEKHLKEHPIRQELLAELDKLDGGVDAMSKELTGIIALFFGNEEGWFFTPWGPTYIFSNRALSEGFVMNDSCLLINLGRIKKGIDGKL